MPLQNKHTTVLKRRMRHLEKRIRTNKTGKPFTYDIAELRALKYLLNMLESHLDAEEVDACD